MSGLYPANRGANLPLGPEYPANGTSKIDWIPNYPQEMSKEMYFNGANVIEPERPAPYGYAAAPFGASSMTFPEWVPWFQAEADARNEL